MSNYLIATASTCDIDASWLACHDVPFVSYSFSIDGQEYQDDCTSATRNFVYKEMRAGKMVHTSAISVFGYYNFFSKLLMRGKDIIYVDMSRAISSSVSNCEKALEQIRSEYPERKIYFMDSYCITAGLNLFVRELVRRHEAGTSYGDLIAWGEAHKLEYIHRFMVEDLTWLRKGGRLSNASALLGTILAIKPELYVDCEGKLIAFEQAHGRKRAIKRMLEEASKDLAPYTADEPVLIETADDPEDGEKLIPVVKEMYPQLAKADFEILAVGPTICAHVGPDFLAFAYHGTKRIL